ncbi:MAG: hypothetical protein GY694_08585 [Gammaproteobacteria bacterium]|nr:hypothetical protein [Gammaproteobacteria bacterium]
MNMTSLNLYSGLLFLLLTPYLQAQSTEHSSQASIEGDSGSLKVIKKSLSIKDILQKYVNDGPHQLYKGTFIYLFEDKIQTIKVHRQVSANGDIIEKLTPMDGLKEGAQKGETLRLIKNHFCFLENHWPYQFRSTSSTFPFRVNNHYQQLLNNYNMSLSGVETVAGLSAVGILIKSKDSYRYGYHLWFEPQTSTLLKYQLIDNDSQLIEQYLFTDINIQSQTMGQKSRIEETKKLNTIRSCNEQFQGMERAFNGYFKIEKLPTGYELISFRHGTIYDTKRQAFQFQLSDGLSSVAIFVEDSKNSKQPINGVLKLGSVNVAGQTLGKHQVTVIGAIPVSSSLNFIKAFKSSSLNLSELND